VNWSDFVSPSAPSLTQTAIAEAPVAAEKGKEKKEEKDKGAASTSDDKDNNKWVAPTRMWERIMKAKTELESETAVLVKVRASPHGRKSMV